MVKASVMNSSQFRGSKSLNKVSGCVINTIDG